MIQPFHSVVARRRIAGGDPTDFVVSFDSAGNLENNFNGKLGFKITLNTSVSITHLARIALSTNSATHVLRIYNSGGTELQNVTIDTNGEAPNTFVFGALPAPIAGSNGSVFYIMSDEVSGGDVWSDNTLTVTTTSIASALNGVYNDGSFNDAGGQMYVPLSFRYT